MGFMAPFPRGTARTQNFGADPASPYNPPGGHTGIDYKVQPGTPVHAAADGIIRASSWLNLGENEWLLTNFGGDMLVLDCFDANGNTATMPTFVYAHLFESTAPVGKHVRKGEVIGISGNSGTATSGPHCHTEAMPPNWDVTNGTYGRVNPDLYFTEYPDEITVQSSTTLPKPVANGGLTMADINSLTAQLADIQKKLAPIQTSPTTAIPIREFIALGTRAAQKAAENTADINVTGGTESIRDFIAKGTRAAQASAAKLAGLEVALKAVIDASGSPVDLAAVTAAAEAGAAKALADLTATVTIAQKAA